MHILVFALHEAAGPPSTPALLASGTAADGRSWESRSVARASDKGRFLPGSSRPHSVIPKSLPKSLQSNLLFLCSYALRLGGHPSCAVGGRIDGSVQLGIASVSWLCDCRHLAVDRSAEKVGPPHVVATLARDHGIVDIDGLSPRPLSADDFRKLRMVASDVSFDWPSSRPAV